MCEIAQTATGAFGLARRIGSPQTCGMIFEPHQLALALLCALLIGMAKGGLAGGLGTLVVPLLSLTMDPRVAAAIVLPILIISDWFAVRAYWGREHRGHLKVLLMGAVIGILIGALTFSVVSEPAMRLLMGLLAIGFVLWRWVSLGRMAAGPQPPETGPGMFWGAISGFTSFTAHAGAPPFQVYLLPKALDKATLQATNVMFFTLVNLVKLPPYILLGQFNRTILVSALVLMPAAALGVWIGLKVQNAIPQALFYRLIHLLMFVTGLKLTWDGARALFWP
jgi:uncharacterized membrane protein YfcA